MARLKNMVPPRLLPIFDALEAAMREVHAGEILPAQATAMANLARALVLVLQSGELEERLRRLEETNGVNGSTSRPA